MGAGNNYVCCWAYPTSCLSGKTDWSPSTAQYRCDILLPQKPFLCFLVFLNSWHSGPLLHPDWSSDHAGFLSYWFHFWSIIEITHSPALSLRAHGGRFVVKAEWGYRLALVQIGAVCSSEAKMFVYTLDWQKFSLSAIVCPEKIRHSWLGCTHNLFLLFCCVPHNNVDYIEINMG